MRKRIGRWIIRLAWRWTMVRQWKFALRHLEREFESRGDDPRGLPHIALTALMTHKFTATYTVAYWHPQDIELEELVGRVDAAWQQESQALMDAVRRKVWPEG